MTKTKVAALMTFSFLIGFGIRPRYDRPRAAEASAQTISNKSEIPKKAKQTDEAEFQKTKSENVVSASASPVPNADPKSSDETKHQTLHLDQPSTDLAEDDALMTYLNFDASEGHEPTVVPDADGGKLTREELSNGDKLDRKFDPDGRLIGESLKASAGGELARSFYGDGSVRGISLITADGTMTSITFLQSGLPKGRLDKLPNGIEITTEYDDSGRILDRWRRVAGGKLEHL